LSNTYFPRSSPPSYKLYHAQSLYKAGMYAEAYRASASIVGGDRDPDVLKLQMYLKYEQGDSAGARSSMNDFPKDDPDVTVLEGCLTFREGKHSEARALFTDANNRLGYAPGVAYSIGLTHYMEDNLPAAEEAARDIIERAKRGHPELGIESMADGIDVRSVGNSSALRDTATIEAFNLRAAVEYRQGHSEACVETLKDMPPREEGELDPVTLHNQALMNMDEKPADGFRKLNFLLQSPPFPKETFANLLLLYVKLEQYDLAADVLAENTHLTIDNLRPEVYKFLAAVLLQETSPEEAYRQYDEQASRHIEVLRNYTKRINDARGGGDRDQVAALLREYDDALAKYIPVLMGMAKIYWKIGHYQMVERIFLQSSEYCCDNEVWKLNVAHTCFMQDKFREAITYYLPSTEGVALLSVPAMTLANLCVSYIMTSQNEKAEDLMRDLEREEEQAALNDDPANPKPQYHLCIINLVIGTLYSAKGNYAFGISRVVRALEPFNRRLGVTTWHYSKRCFLALAETLAKHMIMLQDGLYADILEFLQQAERYGKNVKTKVAKTDADVVTEFHTVAYEARALRRIFLKLRD
jgi:tetratricopeptide repeat protein 30